VNLTRLMALGMLGRYGAMHGHQIRRWAEVTQVGEWGGVSVGALYRELRAMEGEGLVSAVRTEQVGRRPARTVYEITSEGQFELGSLRTQALRNLEYGPDPVGVALSFAFHGADREEVRDLLRARRDHIAVAAQEVAVTRERGVAAGYLDPAQAASMRRLELHQLAELAWHDEFDKVLAVRCAHLPDQPLELPPSGGASR
jgi:DNA-binding PadR family transcriptional regulator